MGAFAEGNEILLLYLVDPAEQNHPEYSLARASFRLQSATSLNEESKKRFGLKVWLLEGGKEELMAEIAAQVSELGKTPRLHLDNWFQYPEEQVFLDSLASSWPGEVKRYNTEFLLPKKTSMNLWRQEYYAFLKQPIIALPSGKRKSYALGSLRSGREISQTIPFNNRLFKAGSSEALIRLAEFLDKDFQGYHWRLSRPALASDGSTSHLSPHLAAGTLSLRQVSQAVYGRMKEVADKDRFSLSSFQDRLRWRDSFRQRLFAQPELVHRNLYPEFEAIYPQSSELNPEQTRRFQAWQAGMTGFPLVDASMRQLRAEGWLNFRMRAMCSNFLTVLCGVPWQRGAEHFMRELVDGDTAIDHWQWQMQAGIVNPFGKAFRIYDPAKNLLERDPKQDYISSWLPEYGTKAYPKAIFDWSKARKDFPQLVADARRAIRDRLAGEGSSEFHFAQINKKVTEKYYEGRNKKYNKLIGGFEQLKLDLG